MSLTSSQLTALLEAFPEPAEVHDAAGTVIAQNQAAAILNSSPTTSRGPGQDIQLHPLGDNWVLRRHAPDAAQHPVAAHSVPAHSISDRPDLVNFDTLARELMHEIRNPLSAIMTAAQLVRGTAGLDEETEMLLGVIVEESRRLNRILQEFSSYLKMPRPQPAVFDLAQMARRLIEQLRRDGVLSSAIEVEVELPHAIWVKADETLVGNALYNILRNAIESVVENSEETGKLRLWTRNEKPLLCLDDTGAGFSEESLRYAFEPFFSTKAKNTGLGLSIARIAVESCGGRLWIENVPPRKEQSKGQTKGQSKAPLPSTRPGISTVHPPASCGARVFLELPAAKAPAKLRETSPSA